MLKKIQKKKIIFRLIVFSIITTPLFSILGGTPFFRFSFQEFRSFLPGILFTGIITLLFWIVNISLLLLVESVPFLRRILLRTLISIVIGVGIAAAGYHFYTPRNPPQPARFVARDILPAGDKKLFFTANGGEVKGWVDSPGNRAGFAAIKMPPPRFFFFPLAMRLLTINIIILALCELIFLHSRKQWIEDENTQLKQMNLEAKNNQLAMQLHPHFLFNSLNTLRLLLKKDPGKAEDYLLKLSEILRFSTKSALDNVVDIREELNLCISYLEMQQVRFGNMLQYHIVNTELFQARGRLPLYSLQLLVENAIKHNAFTEETPLLILIEYEKDAATIAVRNRIQPKRSFEATTRTGLKNLENRYQLLNERGITVTEKNDEFAVTIKIL